MVVNCPAVPENILESELFGYRKGAFTHASQNKIGLFQEAHGGTIFLDEIGDISTTIQTKLLRVLQEKEIKPLGDTKSIQVDVRVIASTNRNLEEKIRRGEFREDLYYRLNVLPITMPPLRERREDIPLLVDHFLSQTLCGTGSPSQDRFRGTDGSIPAPSLGRKCSGIGESYVTRASVRTRETKSVPEDVGFREPLPRAVTPTGDVAGQHLPYRQAKEEVLQAFQRGVPRKLCWLPPTAT